MLLYQQLCQKIQQQLLLLSWSQPRFLNAPVTIALAVESTTRNRAICLISSLDRSSCRTPAKISPEENLPTIKDPCQRSCCLPSCLYHLCGDPALSPPSHRRALQSLRVKPIPQAGVCPNRGSKLGSCVTIARQGSFIVLVSRSGFL